MLFHQITFVLRPPGQHPSKTGNSNFCPMAIAASRISDTFGIGQTHQTGFFTTNSSRSNKSLSYFCLKFKIVPYNFPKPFYAVINEAFSQVHIILNFVEKPLRVLPSKILQVTGRVGIFRPECRPKSINRSSAIAANSASSWPVIP